MTLTLLALGIFFYGKANGYNMDDYGWVPLPAFVIFIFGFAIGAGPIPWLMMGEILPGIKIIYKFIKQNKNDIEL